MSPETYLHLIHDRWKISTLVNMYKVNNIINKNKPISTQKSDTKKISRNISHQTKHDITIKKKAFQVIHPF